MNNIERITLIKSDMLVDTQYLKSLTEAAFSVGILGDFDLERIQLGLIEVLDHKIKRLTDMRSSSVPSETAEALINSIIYSIGLGLKQYPTPDDAASALRTDSISQIYGAGNQFAEKMHGDLKNFYSILRNSAIKTDNSDYIDIIAKEIPDFLKSYNAYYYSHITPDFIAYDICRPIKNKMAIEYAKTYMESLYYENKFCRYFAPDEIASMLRVFNKSYSALRINIYMIVLQTAIGCALINQPLYFLNAKRENDDEIIKILSQSLNIDATVQEAYEKIEKLLELKGEKLKEYLHQSLPEITANFKYGLKLKNFSKIIINKSNTK